MEFTLKTTIKATAKQIYKAWLSTQGHTKMTGGTELTLTHSNVPESGEHYIKGWDEHYFKPMKRYFEFRK
ncbi:hypothetical protein JYT76_00420 [Olleya sp. AH-315-F22]|nr:hypothetical protein [Olleya sp. AH-315-F22]